MIRLFYNKSINQVTRIIVTFTAFITLFITLILFLNTYNEHLEELEKIENDYLTSQKAIIKNETMRAIRYIQYKHKTFGDTMTKEQLQQTIADTIENMRDIRNGSGYVFIYTFDGINIADPILKQNAGKNLIGFKDPNGKLVIKELIEVSKKEHGGYVNYVWNKPTTGTLVNKISYAASYKPFAWMVGSGVYLDDIQKVLKQKKTEYRHKIIGYIIQILMFATALFLTSVALSKYFTYLIEQDINSIKDTLKNVSQNYENIQLEKLTFNEFQEVSKHNNLMIKELEELNLNLENKVNERTKKLQESEQFANELVKKQDKFIKNAIHEINTPLSIIITNIDLFKLKNGENRYLSKIEAGSKIIHNIYNDLSYSIKKDRIEYPDRTINFSEFLLSRVDFFEEIALGNHLRFDLEIQKDIEIFFNDTELQRICDNTISNAIKYSYENNSIIIALFKENNSIILSIQNTGDNIEDSTRLFERFYRENESRGGFGLGLNIINEICEKKGIEIEVESKKNTTKFSYRFFENEKNI